MRSIKRLKIAKNFHYLHKKNEPNGSDNMTRCNGPIDGEENAETSKNESRTYSLRRTPKWRNMNHPKFLKSRRFKKTRISDKKHQPQHIIFKEVHFSVLLSQPEFFYNF